MSDMMRSLVVLALIALTMANKCLASIGESTYSPSGDSAFLVVKSDESRLKNSVIFADWKAEESREIVEALRLSNLSVSPDKTVIGYTRAKEDFSGTVLEFVRVNDKERIFSVEIGREALAHWSSAGKHVLVWDRGNNELLEIDILNRVTRRTSVSNIPWRLRWSKNCSCFLVQFGDYEGEELNKVYRLKDGELVKEYDVRTLTSSPNKRIYFLNEQGRDTFSSIKFFTLSEGEKLGSVSARAPIYFDNAVWWQGETLYPLVGMDLIDARNASVVPDSPKQNFAETVGQLDMGNQFLVGAGDGELILVWGTKSKKFLVYDVFEQKIVNSYEKFWEGMLPVY